MEEKPEFRSEFERFYFRVFDALKGRGVTADKAADAACAAAETFFGLYMGNPYNTRHLMERKSTS